MICVHCGQPIEPIEGWEYYDPPPPIRRGASQSDDDRRRIHSHCVAALTRGALAAYTPDDQDD